MTKSGESTIINHNRQIMSRNLYPKRNSYIKERGTIIMTKIKNTKKGMAKKTLSMSLVVAMLATSNVPVWAAEFSDGSDVAVTSDAEASVAETFSDDVTETPVVEDTTDNTAVATAAEVSSDSFSVTPEFTDNANNAIKDNAVTWGTTVKAKFKVTAKDNKAIDSNIKFHYAWKVNGTADSATDIETPTNEQTVTRATVAAEAGKTLTLFVYATDSNDNNRTVWSYTSEGIAVKAIDVSQVYLSASVDGTHTYNGKPQEIASSDITLTLNDGKQTHETVKANAATVGANFKVVQSGDHTNATKKATVTLVPQADGYTGQISTTYEIEPKTLDGTNDKLISEHMEATLLTSAFTYTGKVIRVKKDDIKLIDKETKEDLSNYIYADKDGYVSISAGNANNLATNVDDVAYARINLIIGTPETGKFKNYNITAEGDNHRTIETTNTFKVTSRDLSDVNVSIKAKTYNDKKKVTIDKNDITFTDKNGNTLDLYKDVVITVPDNATDIGSYKVTITPKELNKNVTGTTTADFNIVGTVTFMVVFYVLNGFLHFSFIEEVAGPAGIAVIHSAFNIIATLVLLPFGDMLVKMACATVRDTKEEKVISAEDQEFMILESRFLSNPGIAIEQSKTAARKMAEQSKTALNLSFGLLDDFQEETAFRVEKIEAKVDRYEDELGTYLIKLNQKDLSLEDSHSLSIMLHCIGDFERISDHALSIMKSAKEISEKNVRILPLCRNFLKITDMKLSVSVKSIMAVPGHKIRFPGPAPPYTTYLLRKKNIR